MSEPISTGGPVYQGRSKAIKVPPCGPTLHAEPVAPAIAEPHYIGQSRAIKAGMDVRSTGERPPLTGITGPVYQGVSRAMKVRSCPIYVCGAQYGAVFDGAPEYYGELDGPPYFWSGGVTAWITSFQGAINDPTTRTTWSVPVVPIPEAGSSEAWRIQADGDGVIVQYIGGTDQTDSWRLSKYTPEGVLIWGPLIRPHDTFHIGYADGLAYTCFGYSVYPVDGVRVLMVDAATGDVVWEHVLPLAPYFGWQSGATKSRGARVVLQSQSFVDGPEYTFHRVGPGGIEASSAPVSSVGPWVDPLAYGGAGIDYYGGLHANPDRFYVWQTATAFGNTYVRVHEWQSYPTVEPIRTVWSYSGPPAGSEALCFDEFGDFYRHDLDGNPGGVEKRSGVDGSLIWTANTDALDDATQFIAKNGLVYVAGYVQLSSPFRIDPVLTILDAATGAVVEPLFEWGQDALSGVDVYGLATP